jgi:UTP--glucose-1-phosphate uridylyltransferase
LLLAEGAAVHGVVYRGIRYDTGMPLGYLQAVVQLAVQRADLGPAFQDWLVRYVTGLGGPAMRAREPG